MTKIETIQNTDPNSNAELFDEEPDYVGAPEGGLYAHDLVSRDYDAALDDPRAAEDRNEIHEDEMHEKPDPNFHNAGLWDEDERRDGARTDEADGREYKTNETDEVIVAQSLGRVAGESELELNDPGSIEVSKAKRAAVAKRWEKTLKAKRGDLGAATDALLESVKTDPDALDAAADLWLQQHDK